MILGVSQFKDITGYDIELFFNNYIYFMNQYYQSIVDYYKGGELVAQSFNSLNLLIDEVNKIEPLFELHQNRFTTIDFWEILDAFSEIQVKLMTCQKMQKWTKSSRLNQFDTNIAFDRGLRQFETFESVAKSVGSNDPDTDWANISIDNLITEEDYTTEGGKIFQVKLQNNANFDLPNIIDSLNGTNIYGKDIVKKFEFVDNDLKTIDGNDNITQSLDTKLSLVKGSVPEFQDMGLDPQSTSTNVNSIQYPTIFRNLLNLFQNDGRWNEVTLLDLFRQDDAIFMKLRLQTILKDSITTNLKI